MGYFNLWKQKAWWMPLLESNKKENEIEWPWVTGFTKWMKDCMIWCEATVGINRSISKCSGIFFFSSEFKVSFVKKITDMENCNFSLNSNCSFLSFCHLLTNKWLSWVCITCPRFLSDQFSKSNDVELSKSNDTEVQVQYTNWPQFSLRAFLLLWM